MADGLPEAAARAEAENRALRARIAATDEVLRAIAAQPADPQPVFDLIASHVRALAGATTASILEFDGTLLRRTADVGYRPEVLAALRAGFPRAPGTDFVPGRTVLADDIVHVADLASEPGVFGPARQMGARSYLGIPLRHEGRIVGVLGLGRADVGAFDDPAVELARSFAEQTVIAMASARLLAEQREVLEQQAVTAEVLGLLNKAGFDLPRVFRILLDSAVRLCGAERAMLYRYRDGACHYEAGGNTSAEYERDARANPIRPGRDTLVGRALLEGRAVQIVDPLADPEYGLKEEARRDSLGSMMSVPLLRDGVLAGVFALARTSILPFTEREIALVTSFAAQAAVGMRNAELVDELRGRTVELQEALDYQTATSDVLQLISRATFDLQPVLQTLVEAMTRLCDAELGFIERRQGEVFTATASVGYTAEYRALRSTAPIRPGRGTITGRVALERRTIQIADVAEDPEFTMTSAITVGGLRTGLGVPLLRGDDLLGVIILGRTQVRPFTQRQIELVSTFADQAVIAIENTRLLTEQAEALARQTATAELLQVINGSPGELAPVFATILDKAHALCGAAVGALFLAENGLFRAVATRGYPAEVDTVLREPRPAGDRVRVLIDGARVQQTADIRDGALPGGLDMVVAGFGVRTSLIVPLREDGRLVGWITANRLEVRAYAEAEIALLESFATQALIAMQNARLITEQREALERQTATAEVLQVINASPGDLAPVFNAMLEKAMRLCGLAFGLLELWDGKHIRSVATRGLPPALADWYANHAARPPGGASARLIETKRPISQLDLRDGEGYRNGHAAPRAMVDLGAARSALMVPLLRDDVVLGYFNVFRQDIRAFSDKEIALLENFAAQAVIAMENARLLTEQREALEQQTATAEVLQVINVNPGDLAPVFDAMLEKAMALCGADFGIMRRYDGQALATLAGRGLPAALAEYMGQTTNAPRPGAAPARALESGRPVHVLDVSTSPPYHAGDPGARAVADLGGARTMLHVPLTKDQSAVGLFTLYRQEVRGFTDQQIALLENFAAQAVIAMENARLLDDLRARTAELGQRNDAYGEQVVHQSATIDVLKAMSASPADPQPIFALIAQRAREICEGDSVTVFQYDGSMVHLRHIEDPSTGGDPSAQGIRRAYPMAPSRATTSGLAILDRRVVHMQDMQAEPGLLPALKARGHRSHLAVPLLRGDVPVGAIMLNARRPGGFSDRQVELMRTFAEQAVIAIDSAETYRALQDRTAELSTQNAHQGATIDVLKVMSSATGDTQPVFDIILRRAIELCGAMFGAVMETDGSTVQLRAMVGWSQELCDAYRLLYPRPLAPDWLMDRAMLAGRLEYVPDIRVGRSGRPKQVRDLNFRAQITLPLIRDGVVVGCIVVAHRDVGGFNQPQIALLETFGEQAVIAMGSAANFRSLQDRTAELTRSVAELQALEEVLRAVNASLDLDTVLDTIISRAVRLSRADEGSVYEYDTAEQAFRLKAAFGMPEDRVAALRNRRIRLGETHIGRAAVLREAVHVSDIQADPILSEEAKEVLRGVHAVLAVPLLREETVVGGLVIRRRSPGDFAPETVALLQTFAAQSVLAIGNARLFQEAGRARAAAEAALADLRRTQDRLVQTEKLASLGQLTAGIAHEIKNPLNFVNNFADLSAELLNELLEAVAPGRVQLDAALREEIDDLAGTLQGNLEKIAQHGRRADSIVKNMLLHSRSGEGEARQVALNELAAEALNLAFHGARAAQADFTITLGQDLDPAAGTVELFPQEITRVLLNLIGNGFYAARKRAAEAGDGVAPALLLATRDRGDSVEVRVRDNGAGIPPAIRERIFQPFFTTKPTGEGTGLGLSLSHDIVVKQHGGLLLVESEPGAFTEFVVTLPRRLRAAG